MKKAVMSAAALLIGINALAQQFDKDTILFNGSSDKHINLVILSDGYTLGELPKFVSDASNFAADFFSESPTLNYKKYFNIFIIKVPSNESGASHPGTATDVTEPVHPVKVVDNYFGSAFDSYSIHRLLVATKTTVISNVLASNYPDYDQALILVNSPYYGGSGGNYTVASTHAQSGEIAAHELGHSFSRLSDEYWAGEMYAAEGLNMTKQTNPSLVKWKNWINTNGIGIYQHCCGGTSGQWYKPHLNCLMQYLGAPFCSVCVQATIERIHTLVSPVESFYPLNSTVSPSSYPAKFRLNLILPSPNTLKRNWQLNGTFLKRNIDSVLISESNLAQGLNTLRVTVEDTTQLLRVDNHSTVHISTVTWSINKIITGIKNITGALSELVIEFYPNPTSEIINIRLAGEPEGKLKLELYDLGGKRLINCTLYNNGVNPVDLKNLKQGVYIAKIFEGKNLLTSRKIIRE